MQQVRCDLRWKAACGLGLLDTGFDPSLLTYFRRQLAGSDDPNRLFAKVRAVVAATGVLAGKHRRALDPTVLDDAVATQDTVTQLIAALRRVIREVPGAGEVAGTWCTAHDYRDPGKPKIAWDDEAARAALVDALVTDALSLLEHLPKQRLSDQAATAVGLLALVAGQDVEPTEGSDGSDGRWRIAQRTAKDRVISTVDPEARHIHKNRTRHPPGRLQRARVLRARGRLFTAVAPTGGSGAANHEAAVTPGLLAGEDEKLTVLGDTAYGTGELRERLQADGHTLVIKPLRCGQPSPAAPPARPASRRPPRRHRPGLAGRIPPMAPAGRAGDRLARRPWQPPRPLPGHRQNNTWLHHRPPPSTSAGWSTSGSPSPATATGRSHRSRSCPDPASRHRPPSNPKEATKIFSGLPARLRLRPPR